MLKNLVKTWLDKLDTGESEFSDEQYDFLLESINKATQVETRLSKYQACKYLHVSRATFDNYIRKGLLPRGKKEQGFKELS